MNFDVKEALRRVAALEKQFDALYRSVGTQLCLSDCVMWVLYFIGTADQPLSQQELIGKMMFPKQTINSAVMGLVRKGLVELKAVPGTRNRKTILLTEAGKAVAEKTVLRMVQAELQAVEVMGQERMECFAELYTAFFTTLRESFEREGLVREEGRY